MKWSQLPPVGTKALPHSRDYVSSPLSFNGFDHLLVSSGTAALGIVLKWLQSQHTQPMTVVIPGYTCPDVVAACVYAGVKPVIIDLAASHYQLNLQQLAALDEPPDAIICPSLFGMSMDLSQIREVAGRQARIIEDNAQWFPEGRITNQVASLKNYPLPDNTHQADFFITSFGRGKPVNLMGGGLVAWNTARVADFAPHVPAATQAPAYFDLKARLFNIICQPVFYGGLTRMPGIHLGATVYHPLDDVHRMDSVRAERLTASILAYLRQSIHTQHRLQEAIRPLWCAQATDKRLLRFPLLLQNASARDHLLQLFNNAGLGASPMYARALKDIDGVAADCHVPFETPVSQSLGERLLTLPLHSNVSRRHVQRMINIADDHRQWFADTPMND